MASCDPLQSPENSLEETPYTYAPKSISCVSSSPPSSPSGALDVPRTLVSCIFSGLKQFADIAQMEDNEWRSRTIVHIRSLSTSRSERSEDCCGICGDSNS